MSHFPTIIAENLNRQRIQIPKGLQGSLNVLIVAFEQWHQNIVDTWISFLTELLAKYPGFDYYELPTIRKMNFLYRGLIDGGMRAGIRSRETQRRTITLYIDKEPFKQEIGIANEDTIHIFLVNKEGEILWRSEGAFDEEKAQSLQSAVETLFEHRL